MNATFAVANPSDGLPQLLLVDDDPVMIRVLARMLDGIGEVRFALSGDDALRVARASVPDLILLDAELGDASGFAICAELKGDPLFRDVPVIFVTSHTSQASELDGFAAGAADFIAKPVSEPLLRARVATHLRMQRMTSELRRLSNTDALTRVANRYMFDQLLLAECNRASRGSPLALLMVDVDHFKLFNDGFGHPAGDACLQSVAHALTSACHRAGDVVARVGGEEFAVVLPSTTLEGATTVARRASTLVRDLGIPHAGASGASIVTISIGIAGYSEHGGSTVDAASGTRSGGAHESPYAHHDAVIRQAADQALYGAKQAGRDRAWMIDLSAAAPMAVPTPAAASGPTAAAASEATADGSRAA